jgi:glycosyltransferase involved in cell wall biosynthesis
VSGTGSRPRVGIDARLAWHTGIGRYVRGLTNALLEDATDFTFVVLTNPKNDPTAVWDWLEGGDAKDEGRLEVAQFAKPVAPYSIAEQGWIAEATRARKLDLLHVPHWNVPLLARVPVVATIHDAIYLNVPDAAPSRLARVAAAFFMKRAARKAVRVLVPSRAAAEEVIESLHVEREKIARVALTADEIAGWVERVRRGSCETISPRVRELPRFVLSAGTHLPHKDVPLLVRAFATVKRELGLRELVLAIAGPRGRGTDAVVRAIQESGAKESVALLGEVTDRDLAYLYDRAACFATASRAEGFGLAPLEGLAAGAPVIASDIAAHREVLGDAALFFPAGDERALVNALARVLGVETFARDLARRGPPRAAMFSSRALARGTANVYRAVLGLAPRPALEPHHAG